MAVLGILSRCQNLRDLERFSFGGGFAYAIRHHSVLIEALGIELRRPPSDSAFRYFFRQMDVAALCDAIRDWTIAQIPGGAADLDQLVCDGKTLRGSIDTHSRWRLGIHCPGDAVFGSPGRGLLLLVSLRHQIGGHGGGDPHRPRRDAGRAGALR